MTDKTGTLTLADMQLIGIYTKENILLDFKNDIKDEKVFSQDQKKIIRIFFIEH